MRLEQGRLPIAHRNVPKQVAAARETLSMARRSPAFGESDPFVQELEKETQSLFDSEMHVAVLKADLKEALANRSQQELRFKKAVVAFVGHVNSRAKGDGTMIVGAGLDLVRQPSRSPSLLAPALEHPVAGRMPGDVKLKWPRVPGAATYQVERALSSSGPFTLVASGTVCAMQLVAQPTNVALWYRVRAIGPAGEGPYSDLVATLAPDPGALIPAGPG